MLELLAMGTDHDAAVEVATSLGGSAYLNHPSESDQRPYSTLVRVSSDNVDAVREIADVALHVAYSRVIKAPGSAPGADRVIASFPLVRHPDLSHRRADDHWRDVHGPLAVEHHAAMCDYTQLAIVTTICGPSLDGLALCAFHSRDDMRRRFFNNNDSRAVIAADVALFADIERSPRRVVLTQATM